MAEGVGARRPRRGHRRPRRLLPVRRPAAARSSSSAARTPSSARSTTRASTAARRSCASRAGTARTLRCQYHSWTYDITDGRADQRARRARLRRARQGRSAACRRCAARSGTTGSSSTRTPTRCRCSSGWRRSPSSWPSCRARRCAPWRRAARSSQCNWKVTAEAFLEVYHFRHIHQRNGESHLDNRGATMGLLPNGASRMITPFSKSSCAAAGMADWDDWRHVDVAGLRRHRDRQRHGPLHELGVLDVPQPDHADRRLRVPVHHVLAARQAHHAHRLDALRPDRLRARRRACRRTGRSGWTPSTRSWPRTSPTWPRCSARWSRRRCAAMPINYQERRIWHFHEQLDRMIGIERIPPELRVEPAARPVRRALTPWTARRRRSGARSRSPTRWRDVRARRRDRSRRDRRRAVLRPSSTSRSRRRASRHGRGQFDHSSAYGQWGDVMVELVEEHTPPLVAPGSGVHHLAFIVDDTRRRPGVRRDAAGPRRCGPRRPAAWRSRSATPAATSATSSSSTSRPSACSRSTAWSPTPPPTGTARRRGAHPQLTASVGRTAASVRPAGRRRTSARTSGGPRS